jgi:putative transposase
MTDDELPDEVEQRRWDEACRRADVIRDFLRQRPEASKIDDVAGLATKLGLSQATVYRLIKIFREGGTVTSLLDRTRGRPKGFRTLDQKRQEIIRTTITGFYLKPTRPPFSRLVREVRANCIAAGLKPPNWRTIRARLEDIELRKRAKQRGEKRVVKATTATPGEYSASRPLEVVQIDHTRADVCVVDEQTRTPIGRPWLTLALDVCSRMVPGFYLTMDAPS